MQGANPCQFQTKDMSKTYLDQIQKSKTLVEGLKNHVEWSRNRGISMTALNAVEAEIEEGIRLNAEVERLRSEIHTLTKQANEHLIAVKDKTRDWKQTVKHMVEQNQWTDYGVMDKR